MIYINKLKRWQAALIATFISFSIALTTYTAQTRVTEIVSDAQNGIVIFYSLIINAVLWLFLSFVIFHFLQALAKNDMDYGYELDNRIANNPSTPVDTLVSLYSRDGQIGTDLTLAANPNTPNDILIALSKRTNERWSDAIVKALKRNPKVRSGELTFDSSMTLQAN